MIAARAALQVDLRRTHLLHKEFTQRLQRLPLVQTTQANSSLLPTGRHGPGLGAHGSQDELRWSSGGIRPIRRSWRGRQDATIDGHNHLDVIVLNNTAYFQADAGAASVYMQLPATTVNQIAQKWVEVPSSDQAYSDVAQDVDIASVLTDTTPSGPLSVTTPTTMDGRKVVGIMGSLRRAQRERGPALSTSRQAAIPSQWHSLAPERTHPTESTSPNGAQLKQ